MTAPHSPTPWTYERTDIDDCEIKDANGAIIMSKDMLQIGGGLDIIQKAADLERAAVCVSACAGLANPDKLPELIAAIMGTHNDWQDADLKSSHEQICRGIVLGALAPIMAALRALQATPAESEASDEQVR